MSNLGDEDSKEGTVERFTSDMRAWSELKPMFIATFIPQ